jgi:hypothetical protein
MKRLLTLLVALLSFVAVKAQTQHSIIIDAESLAPVQTDIMSGVAIDKIGLDTSRRPCARIVMHVNRMSRAEIDGLQVQPVGGSVVVMKQVVAAEGNNLIIELTAKQPTRFYLLHDKYGDSNEVSLNLEGNKEYHLSAQLNITYPIVIATNVIDAEVYIDDVYQGRSDSSYTLTVNDITPGTHKLRVQNGTSIAEHNIEVSSTAIYFRLDVNSEMSIPQYVVFEVSPKDAIVVIDNKNYIPDADGVILATLNNGIHLYQVSAKDYHTESDSFIVSGSKVTRSIELKPAYGWLEIEPSSKLQDANIYIDDIYIGKAPLKSDKLASGKHKIKILKNLYLPYEESITISDNEILKFNPTLTANFANVTLTSAYDAEIYVNNIYKGTSTWTGDLEAGAYIFEARKEGHRTTKLSQNIAAQPQKQSITIDSPTPIYGTINIICTPTIASVEVDGQHIGETPIRTQLIIGTHNVTISKQGYKHHTTQVTIKEGVTENITAALSEEHTSDDHTLITSDPANAYIYVDNKYIGQTPLSYNLGAGKHLIKAAKPGYYDENREVKISDKSSNKGIHFNLSKPDNTEHKESRSKPNNTEKKESHSKPNSGEKKESHSKPNHTEHKEQATQSYIVITSDPVDAYIYIDNKYVGQTPLTYNLEAGKHLIKAAKPGYYDMNKQVKINPNSTNTDIHFNLSKPDSTERED